jgi:hypothetical protein
MEEFYVIPVLVFFLLMTLKTSLKGMKKYLKGKS